MTVFVVNIQLFSYIALVNKWCRICCTKFLTLIIYF